MTEQYWQAAEYAAYWSQSKSTVCSVKCPIKSVLCTVNSVQCAMYNIQCTVYNILCTLYIVSSTLYYCTLYTVHYTTVLGIACLTVS